MSEQLTNSKRRNGLFQLLPATLNHLLNCSSFVPRGSPPRYTSELTCLNFSKLLRPKPKEITPFIKVILRTQPCIKLKVNDLTLYSSFKSSLNWFEAIPIRITYSPFNEWAFLFKIHVPPAFAALFGIKSIQTDTSKMVTNSVTISVTYL